MAPCLTRILQFLFFLVKKKAQNGLTALVSVLALSVSDIKQSLLARGVFAFLKMDLVAKLNWHNAMILLSEEEIDKTQSNK